MWFAFHGIFRGERERRPERSKKTSWLRKMEGNRLMSINRPLDDDNQKTVSLVSRTPFDRYFLIE